MKILLDENMPRHLTRFFDLHETTHVKYQNWQELKNGELLTAMRNEGFEVLVTTDVSIFNQQKAPQHGIAIIILRVFNNKIESIKPLVEAAQSIAFTLQAGEVEYIYAEPRLQELDKRRRRGEFAA